METCSRAFIVGENRSERFGEFKDRSVKTRDAVEVIFLLQNYYFPT